MVAKNLLKARMTEMGKTQKEVARRMGISAQTLSYKLNGRIEFKVSEIDSLCDELGIRDKERYFFAEI